MNLSRRITNLESQAPPDEGDALALTFAEPVGEVDLGDYYAAFRRFSY